MKMKILLFCLLLTSKVAFGQTLTYEQTRDLNIASNFSNGDTIAKYVMKDGSEIVVGSTLKFGSPWNKNIDFTTLLTGKFSLGKALLAPPIYLNENFIGENIVVTAIKVSHTKMSKNSSLMVWAYVSPFDDGTMSKGYNYRTILDLELAIERKEVINPNGVMSREQALAKMKEAKDLLDLGIMTQSDYDALKEKLTPIILKTP
jgi:hypothetical protein